MSVVWSRVDPVGLPVDVGDYVTVRSRIEPTWSKPEGIRLDIQISTRWVMEPLPMDVDRRILQIVLDHISWVACPIRQLGRTTWLVGAAQPPPQDTVQVREGLVLITEHVGKKPLAEGSSAVLAAPGSVRRAADKTVVRCGPASVAHPVLPPQVSVCADWTTAVGDG